MRSLHIQSLHRACSRYGPERLPRAGQPDIGAGYAAASAALAASLLFTTGAIPAEVVGLVGSNDGVVWFAFAGFAVSVVVPAAFAVGVLVWRLLPAGMPIFGPDAGLLGTLGTYISTVLLVAPILTLTAVLVLSGADPASAAGFSFGLVFIAFMLTWWLTFPVGVVSDSMYAAVVEEAA